jgi:hypothetical protein
MFTDYLTLMHYHLELHPGCTPQDLYKLLFQSIHGPEHLLNDIGKAQAWLRQEWEVQPAESEELLCEPVSLDEQVVRINIRPLKALGADWRDLWAMFHSSADEFWADKNEFRETWQQVLEWIKDGRIPLQWSAALELDTALRIRGYPAAHHSESYRRANRPAYRVINRLFLFPFPVHS